MYSIQRFDNVGQDTTVSVSNSSAVYVGPTNQSRTRQGVVVCNCDATAILYFKFYTGSSVPTVNSGNFHFQLAPGAEKTVMCGGSVNLAALSTGGSATNAQIVELL